MQLLREAPRPAIVREHPLAPWFAVGTVCLGAFMGQLDASVVTLAFPALQRQYGVGLAGVQWVSLAYLLTLVALLVPVGRWSDRCGRKLVYLYGFVLFTAASAGRGLAPTLGVLIVVRVVQAAGAAMLQANSVALVATSAPAGRRRAALGIQAGAHAVGLALGPVAGGLLVASAGWRSIFFINIPVGVVAVAAGWFLLPRTRPRAARQGTDPLGLGLPRPGLAGSAAVALLAGAGLVRWERGAAAPLVDLKMLAANGTWPLLAGALCAYLVLFGPLVLIPQVLTAHGGSVVHAGLLLAALPAGFGLAAVAGEKILPARWPDRRRCLAGGLLASGCAAALAIPAPDIVIATWLGLLGIGLGTYIPANNTAILTAIPPGQAAAAGGMVNMARGLGTALGVAVVALALHTAARLGHPSAGPAAAMAALAMCALASAWARRRVRPGGYGRYGGCCRSGVPVTVRGRREQVARPG